MKLWKSALVVLIGLLLALGLYLLVQLRTLEVETLSEDLYVLRGLGGNTAVLRTGAGAVIVDSMTLPMQGKLIREIAKSLTGEDPVLLINTHYHPDHTHGNPGFEPGTRIVSTERTLSHLNALDSKFWSGEKAELLPNETITDRQTLNIGSKTVEIIHPGPGHTDGDLVVLFADERVIHTGDLLFYGYYPLIDLGAGGSVQQWPHTLDRVLELSFDRVIPGHGLTTDRAGLKQFQAFLNQLASIGRSVVEEGLSLDETLATDQLSEDAGYKPIQFIIPLGLDRDLVLERTWEEATGNFIREN